ncbi:hypothetical protein B6N60_02775 [Richelia sinica FACHB-800]|uniref:Uncharacterized protein n=1 Tax=Richelia sinica FACHB-800 TaxID=1357546 RepID=A0A975Y5C5_9NOST|nr:hypothetical protein B6N60_02775 [Richelia sinica FACHB-800]
MVSCGNSSADADKETKIDAVSQSQPQTTTQPVTNSEPEDKETEESESANSENQEEETQLANNTTTRENNKSKNKPVKQLQVGTVTELVNGDLLCYATLVDDKGTPHNVGASFEICADSAKYLNKKVRVSYEIASVNDCESAEPCGKTRKESIITKMDVIDEKSSEKSSTDSQNQAKNSDSQTLSNGEWTITIGNSDSWTGVNGTGNLSYKGCDAKGKCLNLTGGKVVCRDGKCLTGWANGDYTYVLEQPMSEDSNNSSEETTLTVRKGDNEILKATGFKSVPAN